MQYAATTAQCPTCESVYRHLDRDEDGRSYFETTPCSDPTCEVRLCGGTCAHLSFTCDGCGGLFCLEHLILIPDGTDRPLKVCTVCCEDVKIEPAPLPRRLAMLAEAGCTPAEAAAFIREVA